MTRVEPTPTPPSGDRLHVLTASPSDYATCSASHQKSVIFGRYYFRRRTRNFERFTAITQKPTVNLGRPAALRHYRPTELKIWYMGGTYNVTSVGPVTSHAPKSTTIRSAQQRILLDSFCSAAAFEVNSEPTYRGTSFGPLVCSNQKKRRFCPVPPTEARPP
jgi:hypothetical protein